MTSRDDRTPPLLVARHWAEHRLKHRIGRGPQITIRRWGWSDASEAAAAAHARVRAEAALAAHLAGTRTTRREAAPGYHGADGMPIREEILSEHPELGAVITRNAYAARCLNVADVMFADADDPEPAERGGLGCGFFAVLVAGAGVGAIASSLVPIAIATGLAIALSAWGAVRRRQRAEAARQHAQLPERLSAWCSAHPAWRLRIYRTPAGYRLMATHAPVALDDPELADLFRFIAVDPVYARMCRKQSCFRARLTGKPWRMGVDGRAPRGTWPHRDPAARERRERFIAACEAAAPGFAACRFIADAGSAPEHPRCAAVRALHDRECRALSDLPLA